MQSLQFVLTEERVQVQDGVAWVTVDENLLGDQGGSTVAADGVKLSMCATQMKRFR